VTARVLVIRGQAYLTLETMATCYAVEVAWIEEVYEHGLLGRGEEIEGSIAVAAVMLDRFARILQLHRQQGINVAGISSLFGARDWDDD
jgi:hypothetical protein